jgi:hypothetical protein
VDVIKEEVEIIVDEIIAEMIEDLEMIESLKMKIRKTNKSFLLINLKSPEVFLAIFLFTYNLNPLI